MIRLLQISDMHLFANPNGSLLGLRTNDSFAQVIQMITQQANEPDLIVLTGDLSHDTTPQSYQYLVKKMKVFSCPIYWIPGNHDQLSTMQEVLDNSHLLSEKKIELENWGILLLNSLDPGKVTGFLAENELQKLRNFIATTNKENLLVILHHQPIPVGSTWLDGVGLQNATQFNEILHLNSRCKNVLFGHVHQSFDQQYQNIRYIAGPATSIQFLAKSADFALAKLAPGFQYLNLDTNGNISVSVHRLEKFNFSTIDFSAKGY